MGDWIDRYIEAWNSHDATAIFNFMTEDAVFIHWWDGEWKVWSGRDAIITWIDALATEWSTDYRLERTFGLATGGGFAIEYVESGVNDSGDEATGKRFSIRSAFIGELRSGKISRITDYANLLEYSKQVGS